MHGRRSWLGLLALGMGAATATPAGAQSAIPACVPECRAGFTCVNGMCVSQCNPPCLSGEACTEQRECVLRSELDDPSTVRRHDGFYLSFGLGVGYLSGDITEYKTEGQLHPGDSQVKTEGSVAGIAQLGEIMVGGTIPSGPVLGGGAWGMNALSAHYDGEIRNWMTDELATGSSTLKLTSLSQIGPFLAYYPDASGGLHGMLAPTLVLAKVGDKKDLAFEYDDHAPDGVGWGLVLGAGYDFWIGEQWSLGVTARFQYVSVWLGSTEPASTLGAIVPGVLASVTYH